MWLIVGLGNPGHHTRHNLGFMVIDRVANDSGVPMHGPTCQALTGRGQLEGQSVVLAKPQTFMNRSGAAVSCLVTSLSIPLSQVLVIVDDFALPLGKLRLRVRGSDGGHNGLKSIIEALGTERFPRLRLGIHPPEREIRDAVDFVLSPFTREERDTVELMIEQAQAVIRTALREGFDQAMTKYN
jgi:PTH1 family peptidyl-tRNA hydrolase